MKDDVEEAAKIRAHEAELKRIQTAHDLEIKKVETRGSTRNVLMGTAIVGVAASAFPFFLGFSEAHFAERIEQIKATNSEQIEEIKAANATELADLELTNAKELAFFRQI